jgi:hypothetical protein
MLNRALFSVHIEIPMQDFQSTPLTIMSLLEYVLRKKIDLQRQVGAQKIQIKELRAKLSVNSSNSSCPPSSNSLYTKKENGKAGVITYF